MNRRLSFHLNRRRLLQSTGLAAGSLFLPSLFSKRAAAQAAPPRRLVIFFSQHGTVYDNWRMRPAGQPDNADFSADLGALSEGDFSPILAPLYAMRNKLTVLDGLSLASAEGDEPINEHTMGTAHALTGKFMVNGIGGGPSFDQIIAEQIAVAGRVNSLELSVVGAANGGAVYRASEQSLPASSDVIGTYQRLFPASSGTGEETVADKVTRVQPDVLDFVRAEYDRVSPRLSREDKQKLDLHRDLVRDVAARVRSLQGLTCERPSEPALENDFGIPGYFDTRLDAFSQIVTSALACDLTRVVSIQLGQLTNAHCGAGPGDIHADFAHQHEVEPGHTVMTEYGRVHAQQFANLLATLDSVPEGSGTLLDSTVVVWCNELSTGTHSFLRWPVVIGGGGSCGIDTGRYLRWAPSVPTVNRHPTWSGVEPTIGPPHNRMWNALAPKLGATIGPVGETELFTTEGVRVDCATPLDRI